MEYNPQTIFNFAYRPQISIKEQQRYNECSILQSIAWFWHSPGLNQKPFFLGVLFHKRINVVSGNINVFEDGWKVANVLAEMLWYFIIILNITKQISTFEIFQIVFLPGVAFCGQKLHVDAVWNYYLPCLLSTNHIRNSQWRYNPSLVNTAYVVSVALSLWDAADLICQSELVELLNTDNSKKSIS